MFELEPYPQIDPAGDSPQLRWECTRIQEESILMSQTKNLCAQNPHCPPRPSLRGQRAVRPRRHAGSGRGIAGHTSFEWLVWGSLLSSDYNTKYNITITAKEPETTEAYVTVAGNADPTEQPDFADSSRRLVDSEFTPSAKDGFCSVFTSSIYSVSHKFAPASPTTHKGKSKDKKYRNKI